MLQEVCVVSEINFLQFRAVVVSGLCVSGWVGNSKDAYSRGPTTSQLQTAFLACCRGETTVRSNIPLFAIRQMGDASIENIAVEWFRVVPGTIMHIKV